MGLALAVAGSFTACDEESDAVREISPEFTGANEVYFPVSAESKEFDPSEGISSYTVTVARRDSVGEAIIPIQVLSNDENIFKVPTSVTFADKATTADLEISFPGGAEGITYGLKIMVDNAAINPYLDQVSTYQFSFVNLAWQTAELPAVWEDGIFMAAFGVDYVPFYVNYQYVKLSDGSAKYRFLNPFASTANDQDKYGVCDGYPYNDPGDYDEEGTYNLVVNVSAKGVASMEEGEIGVDWGYGMFATGSVYGNLSTNIDSYPLGELKDGAIAFPDNSLFFYLPTNGYYIGKKTTIWIDTEKYWEDHSVMHISELEDGFNNADIEWNEVEGAKFTEFVSAAFDKSWENQALVAAEDMDPNAGDQSEFLNLYALTDLYAEGSCLAFYWDKEKNKLSVPTQPTGITFAGKKILVRDAGESVVEMDVEHYTISCTKFSFNLELITEDENLIGNYTETYYWSTESKPAPEITKDFFLGNFVMTGKSQFNGEPDANAPVAIYEDEEGNVIIEGVTYSPIIASYNDEAKTLSFAPQQLADYGPYDLTLYTTTLDGEVGETEADAVVLSVADPFSGVLAVDETSTCDGFLVNSDAAGGWVDGYWGLEFSPAPAAAPAVKSAVKSHKFTAAKHEVAKVSTANLKIQGKASRHAFKSHAKAVAF